MCCFICSEQIRRLAKFAFEPVGTDAAKAVPVRWVVEASALVLAQRRVERARTVFAARRQRVVEKTCVTFHRDDFLSRLTKKELVEFRRRRQKRSVGRSFALDELFVRGFVLTIDLKDENEEVLEEKTKFTS